VRSESIGVIIYEYVNLQRG